MHAGLRAASIIAALLGVAAACPAGAQEIELHVTTGFLFGWNDVGSGGNNDGSFWNPDTLGVGGVHSFGGAARSNYTAPSQMTVGESLTGVGTPGAAFAHPLGFTQVWNDSGSGANNDGSFWAPIPPAGYVSLGTVPRAGYSTPPVTSVVCVRADLAVQGTIGAQIYNDSGTGANSDFSAWDIVAPPGALDLGTFIGVGNWSQPPDSVAWCLRSDAVIPVTAPTRAGLESLIATFGPILRIHPSELYLPDDPTGVLDDPSATLIWALVQNPDSFSSFNQTILGGTPTSSTTILDDVQAALSVPQATDPTFRYYIDYDVGLSGGVPTLPVANGDLARAKAYVRVRPLDGVVTELQFWIWYPWNGPGKAEAQCGSSSVVFNPTGDAGTHYADWECVRVRTTDKTLGNPGSHMLLNVQMSRHSFDVEVPAANLTYSASHPVVYVAKDSHAHYPGPGTFDYDRVSSTDIFICTAAVDTFDQTADGGPALDASKRFEIVSSEWPTIDVNPPDWFFFAGQWGGFDPNQFCVSAFGVNLYCFEEIGNGKPGLLRRIDFDASVPLNADLGSLRIGAESRGAACSNPDAVIDDVTPFADTVTISGGPTSIDDVVVLVDISHTSVDDLEVILTSPAGTSVLLHDHSGGSDDHLFVRYTTAGDPNGVPYGTGRSMVAAGAAGTASWIGEDANGAWTLEVLDDSPGNSGVVLRWCVTATDLTPFFDPDVTSYTLDVPAGTLSTSLAPQAMNHEATVSVVLNGVTVPIETDANPAPGQSSLLGLGVDLPLLPGTNTASITVEFASGPSRTYDVTIQPSGGGFRRGDVSADGAVQLNDAIVLLAYLFSGGAAPSCFDAADSDDNGGVALNDAIIILGYLFSGGPPPAAPGPLACGGDVEVDALPLCTTVCP